MSTRSSVGLWKNCKVITDQFHASMHMAKLKKTRIREKYPKTHNGTYMNIQLSIITRKPIGISRPNLHKILKEEYFIQYSQMFCVWWLFFAVAASSAL